MAFDKNDFSLREIREEDKALILEWRNSDRIRSNMYSDHIIGIEEHEIWYSKALRREAGKYLIFEYKGRPVGFVSFTNIDIKNQKCYWAFYLGDVNCPRGTGSVMEIMALDFVFDKIKIRKLCCEVFDFNASVIKMHEKFGFTKEGILRNHCIKNGEFKNVILLSMFNEEWNLARESMNEKIFG